MEVTISNEIIVKEPSAVLIQWARENLVFENPEYINRTRRGLWTGNTDRYLTMYKVVSETGSHCPTAIPITMHKATQMVKYFSKNPIPCFFSITTTI